MTCLSLEFIDFTKTSSGNWASGKAACMEEQSQILVPHPAGELGIPGSSGACLIKCSSTSFQPPQVLQCLSDLKNKRKQKKKKQTNNPQKTTKIPQRFTKFFWIMERENLCDFGRISALLKLLKWYCPQLSPKKLQGNLFFFLLSTSSVFYSDIWCWQYQPVSKNRIQRQIHNWEVFK